MPVIHPVRKGNYILIPDHEFSALIQEVCLAKSVEIIEDETEGIFYKKGLLTV